jgi:hypothetical protein
VQRSRIEIRSIRPYKCFHFWINRDLVEQLWIKKRTIQFTSKNRSQVDHLLHVVCKLDAQYIRPDDLNGANLMNRMIHGAFLREWCYWQGLATGLQSVPIRHQFCLMQFSPCFD